MSFLKSLSEQLSSQLSLGENTNHNLDAVVNGQNVKYGALGDISKKIDKSAERKYVEEGFLRRDPYNADPKQMEILLQQPNATVLVKKRMFSSIAENFRPDYMDADEKLYYKTMRILFANKCAQISALEKLSKIQNITSSIGNIPDTLIPIILTLGDAIASGGITNNSSTFTSAFGNSPVSTSEAVTPLLNVMDQLRKIYSFNSTSLTTNWIVNNSDLFQSTFGQGTGTIEITNFTNITTNCSVDSVKNAGSGSFNLSIVDPYEAMLITEWDIEKAISDATNMFKNSSVFQLVGEQGSEQVINDRQVRLNQIRSSRGASPITIKINPATLLGKRVTAIFDRTGTELLFNFDPIKGLLGDGVSISDEYLRGGLIAAQDGLDTSTSVAGIGPDRNIKKLVPDSERSVFGTLITAIFTKLQLEANSQNAFQISNTNTNNTRRKLRFNFSGKLIIQPMDVVHIYMSSKSQWDNRLLGGLNSMFNGFGVAQSLNSLASNINTVSSLLNPGSSATIQAEKAAYVGASFPNSLWFFLRSQFINENEGTHVFAGVVERAEDTWSNGSFTVNISGMDNTFYFDQGKVNFKPGVDVFNGAIFDPLTPFKSNFDTISSNSKDKSPELLDENKALLGTKEDKKGLVKIKSGPNAGQKLASDHRIGEEVIDPHSGTITRTFHAPDGLVYKWKEGIGVFIQFGNSLELNDPDKIGNPSITTEPFAGQNIMNVLSLLVTGQPYNYSTYWKTANSLFGFGRDGQSQQDASHTYIASLQNELIKHNALWGNFIPFKKLVVDEKSFALAQNAQFRVVQKNAELDTKLKQLQELNNQAALFSGANVLTNISKLFIPEFEAVKAKVTNLQTAINADIFVLTNENNTFLANAANSGTDASFDYTDYIDSSKLGIAPSNNNLRKELRRQMNYLTRRMSYNVRANEDKNLFIVDDLYDKDYDLLAYEKSLEKNGLSLYNNDFNSTREKINITSELLNLEVFADTQGHIRVRPPQYNRIPSSVFYRMMYLKQAYGVQIFPQFLDDLFINQIDTLRKRIEILDDLIRLDCAIVLGTENGGDAADQSATEYILGGTGTTNNTGATSNTGSSFAFVSNPDGMIVDINQLMHSTNPDESQVQVTNFITSLSGQVTSNKEVFPNTTRYTKIILELKKQNQLQDGASINGVPSFNANSYIDQLISRIQTKSGERINKRDYVITDISNNNGLVLSTTAVIDIFKVTQELQKKLQERQKVIRLFYSVLSNASEFKSLDNNSTKLTNQLLAPAIYGNSEIPEVFEHMIEDESYNDYGGNSGQRYIIKRAQIRQINISETPPDYTMVQVQGVLDPNNPSSLPEGLNSFPNNGNGMVTAVAVDYDAWRNYGFKNQATITVPFLSDPNTQCAPYAAMILSRARKNILRGTVTISGNEYMQPGEVVYLEDRGLLFYVTSVRHSFEFRGTFTTTLDLSYGHSAGEYIPTTLDVIGKMIYNNRDISGYAIQRQANSADETNMGVVLLSPKTSSSDVPGISDSSSKKSNSPQSSFSTSNESTLNNILYQAAYLINANNTAGNNIVANIELRIYYDKNNTINTKLQNFAEQVKNILTGKINTSSSSTLNGKTFQNQSIPQNNVNVILVSLDDENDRRSPSQKAIDAARNQINNNALSINLDGSDTTTPISSNDQIRSALFGYIIDCWLAFASAPIQTTGGN